MISTLYIPLYSRYSPIISLSYIFYIPITLPVIFSVLLVVLPNLPFFGGAVPGFAIFQRRTPCQLPCRCIFWKPRSVVAWATLSGDGKTQQFGQLFLWCFPLLLWFLGDHHLEGRVSKAELPGSLEFQGNTCWRP